MSEEYFVPCEEAESEFTEKRSRFIGRVARVETEADARAYIETIKSGITTPATTAGATLSMRAISSATVTTASRRAQQASRC